MCRRPDLDLLKAVAIMAVVFYHIGILPMGYLGVDVFMVVSGYLVLPRVIDSISSAKFSYAGWLWKRFSRFLPLVIMACGVAMAIGYFTMLPDEYENLGAASVSSELFSNNVLQAITTRNYWNSLNEYKPLLAFWYLGVVAQVFVVFPLLMLAIRRCCGRCSDATKVLKTGLIVLTALSLGAFLLYDAAQFCKFYYPQYRFWEFGVGALAYYLAGSVQSSLRKVSGLMWIGLITMLLYNAMPLEQVNRHTIVGLVDPDFSRAMKLGFQLATVGLAAMLVCAGSRVTRWLKPLAYIGMASLSIYVWHQLILAFMRYILSDELSVGVLTAYLGLTALVSVASYNVLERVRLRSRWSIGLWGAGWVLVLAASFIVYHRAGVVRDVPELGVTCDNPYTARNTSYTDRIYGLANQELTDSTRVPLLVIGNSFARDFASCLLEWDTAGCLEIAYMPVFIADDPRYARAKRIYVFGGSDVVPPAVWRQAGDSAKIYGIGSKNFGKSAGPIFNRRNRPGYYSTTIPVPDKLRRLNDFWRRDWQGRFVDMLSATLDANGNIRLFTPDSMLISFDCNHLTAAGGRFLATRLDMEAVLPEVAQVKKN